MKAVVQLMIIILLVDQRLCQDITPSSCSEGTIEWMWTKNQGMYQFDIKVCLFNTTCYKSEMPMTLKRANRETICSTTDCNSCHSNISYILETSDKCTCRQFVTSSQDCSDSTTTSASFNNDLSTNLIQDILIPLIAILSVLLAIVTVGWVCTCWAMHKNRRREMNINTTNIR